MIACRRHDMEMMQNRNGIAAGMDRQERMEDRGKWRKSDTKHALLKGTGDM